MCKDKHFQYVMFSEHINGGTNLQALTFFPIFLLFHAVCILRPEESEEFWHFTKLWQFTECVYVAVQLLTQRTHKLKWLVNVHASHPQVSICPQYFEKLLTDYKF